MDIAFSLDINFFIGFVTGAVITAILTILTIR